MSFISYQNLLFPLVIFSEIVQGIEHRVKVESIEYSELVYFFLSFIHHGQLQLSIDQTEWDFGKTRINILCLVVSIGKMVVPLYFELLDNNSHHTDRILLF